jgi:ankyrin repeat protein
MKKIFLALGTVVFAATQIPLKAQDFQMQINAAQKTILSAPTLKNVQARIKTANKESDNYMALMTAACVKNDATGVARILSAMPKGAVNHIYDNLAGHHGAGVIWCAVGFQNTVMVKVMLDHGAALDGKSATGWTLAMEAAATGNDVIVHLLHSHGANFCAKNKDGQTAADMAKSYGFPKIAQEIKSWTKTCQ